MSAKRNASVRPRPSALRVSRENPHYFEYRGTPVFLVGATHWDGWTPVSMRNRDYRKDLERLAGIVHRAGHSHVRGLVRVIPYFPDTEGPQPWKTLADGRFDLECSDPEWEERLTAYLDATVELGLVVSLELWEDYSVTRGPGSTAPPGITGWKAWEAHPFNPNNNVNYGTDVLPDTTEVEDAPFYRTIPERKHIKTVLEIQKRYADRLVDLTVDYPNVLYNLSNESRASLAWSRYWARHLRSRFGDARLITDMPSSKWKLLEGESDPELSPLSLLTDPLYDYVDISQVVCKYVPAWEVTAAQHAMGGATVIGALYERMRLTGNVKPLLVSKHFANNCPDGIPVLWSLFAAGAAGARFHRPFVAKTAHLTEDFQFEQIEHLARYLKDIAFWKMRPAPESIADLPEGAAALALARPGIDYVIQLLDSRKGTVKLALGRKGGSARWYNPALGRYIGRRMPVNSPVENGTALAIPADVPELLLHLTCNAANRPVRMILDTDMGNDIDDALALAMIHGLANRGEVDLLAVNVSGTNPWGAVYVDLVNHFYGRPDIPVGVMRNPGANPTGASTGTELFAGAVESSMGAIAESGDVSPSEYGDYARVVAQRKVRGEYVYPRRLRSGEDAPEAVEVLRRTLAGQPDGSIVLVSVGFLTNLAHLLESGPDEFSPLGGRELARRKIRLYVMMAGDFSSRMRPEFNITGDIEASRAVLKRWPTPLVASGFEIGLDIRFPAECIENDFAYVENHPIAEGYRTYQAMPHNRPAWDLTAVLYAARPDRDYFGHSPKGTIELEANGATRFAEKKSGTRRYLTVTPEQILRIREALVWLASEPPESVVSRSKPGGR